MCFVWIWEQTAIISLFSINWLVCVTETECLLRGTDWIFIDNSSFRPHSVFMCFVWIWEQTAIISLYNINWLVSITEMECVYCAVRTEYINVGQFLSLMYPVAASDLPRQDNRLRTQLRLGWNRCACDPAVRNSFSLYTANSRTYKADTRTSFCQYQTYIHILKIRHLIIMKGTQRILKATVAEYLKLYFRIFPQRLPNPRPIDIRTGHPTSLPATPVCTFCAQPTSGT